jgi:hypothetical protein
LGELQRAQVKRYFVRLLGVSVVIQVGLSLIIGWWSDALLFVGVISAVAVLVIGTARFSFTEVTDEGIRTRAFFSPRRSCPWPQVADLQVRSNVRSTTVRVLRTDGTRFTLGVPVTGDVMLDPMFYGTLEEIVNAWRAHAPEDRRQPLASPKAQFWRRFGLAAAATSLWVVTPLLLLDAALTAHDNGSRPDGRTQAVVASVDRSFNPPMYELHALPGNTFPASEAATSATVAYSDEMAGDTRVGDQVTVLYPRSNPILIEDERLEPATWHLVLPRAVAAVVGFVGSIVLRRWLTRARRVRPR